MFHFIGYKLGNQLKLTFYPVMALVAESLISQTMTSHPQIFASQNTKALHIRAQKAAICFDDVFQTI